MIEAIFGIMRTVQNGGVIFLHSFKILTILVRNGTINTMYENCIMISRDPTHIVM